MYGRSDKYFFIILLTIMDLRFLAIAKTIKEANVIKLGKIQVEGAQD